MKNHIYYLAKIAAKRFGAGDGTFNSANFSQVMCEALGISGPVDGRIVEFILLGQDHIINLTPGTGTDCHWRIRG
jgi:hypothetical protein